MSSWAPYETLPEFLSQNEMANDQAKDRQIVELKDRVRRLEDQLLTSRPALSGIQIAGFELTPTVIFFGLVIGLTVYTLTKDTSRPKHKPAWAW